MATNNTSSSNPWAAKMCDELDALFSGIPKTAANEPKLEPPTPGYRGPGRTCPRATDRNNARRSLVVFSRTPSALAHRRRGVAVIEDRGKGLVPAQRH